MKKPIIAILCSAVAAASLAAGNKDYPVAPVPFTSMHVQDEFWFPRMETNRRVTMKADFKKCEETGPIVYCLEGVDNEQVFNLVLPDDAKLVANCRDDLLGGVTVIRGDVRLAVKEDGGKAITEPARMLAIPHYALCNRGPAEINVWLARTAEKAPDDK